MLAVFVVLGFILTHPAWLTGYLVIVTTGAFATAACLLTAREDRLASRAAGLAAAWPELTATAIHHREPLVVPGPAPQKARTRRAGDPTQPIRVPGDWDQPLIMPDEDRREMEVDF